MAKPREPSLPETQIRVSSYMNIQTFLAASNYQVPRAWEETFGWEENQPVVNVNCVSKNVEIPLGGDLLK